MRVRAAVRGISLLALEVGALALLYRGGLPSVEWSDAGAWLDRTPPEDAILAIVRSVALVATWYLVAATLLVTVASVTRIPALLRGVRLVSLPGLRRAIEGVAAMTLATAPILNTAPAFASPAAHTVVRTELPAYTPTPAGDGSPYEPVPAGDVIEPERIVHVVVAGDSLWSIAEAAVPADTADRSTAVDAYWRSLVELNAATIRSGDPDLIFPGEVIILRDA